MVTAFFHLVGDLDEGLKKAVAIELEVKVDPFVDRVEFWSPKNTLVEFMSGKINNKNNVSRIDGMYMTIDRQVVCRWDYTKTTTLCTPISINVIRT